MLQAWKAVGTLPGWLRAVLIGVFVNAAGALAWVYLTLYLVDVRQLSTGRAGLVSAAYGLGLILGNLFGGGAGDRFGMRRALLVSLLGWAAGGALVPIAPLFALAPVLFASGAVAGAGRPLLFAVVLAAVPRERRREGAALGRMAFNAGSIIGPPLGALATGRHFWLIFVLDAASSIVLACVVWRFAPADGPRRSRAERRAGPRLLETLRGNRMVVSILATVVVVDTAYRQISVGLPLQLRDIGAPTIVYGSLLSLNCVAIVLFEVWVAMRLAHRRIRSVIAAGYALVGVGWLVFGLHPAVLTAVAGMLVLTVGEMFYKPTATAAVADAAPAGFEGRYQSLYAAASISGTVLAPAIGGSIYEHHPALLWVLAALAPIVAAVAVARWAGQPEPSGQRSVQ